MTLTSGSRAALGALALACASPVACAQSAPTASPARQDLPLDYAIGADLSFLAQAESRGVQFRDSGVVKPGLQLFRDHGYNWIRLRVFHTVVNSPWPLPNDLPYTLALAKSAKALGYKFLLDFHYSDTWADPDKQYTPKAWEQVTGQALIDSVEAYTRLTIATLRDGGAMPDMVQIGNEISVGMIWPQGKLPDKWDTLAELLKAGVRGVKAGAGSAPMPLIMMHIDKGGDVSTTRWWFDNALARGVEFDVIGQSYYP
ncbi:MAG: glycosyl hydrolase 53 family protein [Gemmatimonadetes bacterium]|nr:glycosyl hydrolase 53 family protein [Gemmatimonadota bacterium]